MVRRWRGWLSTLAVAATVVLSAAPSRADDLVRNQLPWNLGVGHHLSGSWYGEGRHKGPDAYALDFDLKYEPVLAVQSGTVTKAVSSYPDPGTHACYAQRGGSYGNFVTVSHAGGYESVYAHLSVVQVTVGTPVTQGQQLGTSGNTGNSCGAHLHFALRKDGQAHMPTPMGGYTEFPKDRTRAYVSKNADTLTDLLTVDGAGSSRVLFADARGEWKLGPPTPLPSSLQLVRGRFNSDRPGDLFAYDNKSSGNVLFATGAGAWRQRNPARFSAGWIGYPGAFNTDTVTDVALYNATSGATQVVFGDRRGGWAMGPLGSLPAGRTGVVGNFDATRPDDLLLYDAKTGTAQSFLADGTGAWKPGAEATLPAGGTLIPGRFNTDAATDLALTSGGGLAVWFSDGAGGWTAGPARNVWQNAQVVSGVLNADGFTDLVYYASIGNAQVLFADGAGKWKPAPIKPVGPSWQLYPGAFDGDALTDVLLYDPVGRAQVLFADGAGAWRTGALNTTLGTNVRIYPASFGNGP